MVRVREMLVTSAITAAVTSSLAAPRRLVTTTVTPAPCDGSSAAKCPYYWHKPQEEFYQVWVNGFQSFVYLGEIPPECSGGYKAQPGHCARQWNVQSQSYTMASVDTFSTPVEVRVVTKHGRLAGKTFRDAQVVGGFWQGSVDCEIVRARGVHFHRGKRGALLD